MSNTPLAEVFGFPPENRSPQAQRGRAARLCPFNNRVPNCTKDKAKDPLGVCSIQTGAGPVITCPVRFRQHWQIVTDAAAFFFPRQTSWTSVSEVPLLDRNGRAAGNLDLVLVAYDEAGHILDFGAVEIQAVYISGNVRRAFEAFMQTATQDPPLAWLGSDKPRPDFLSSSRKRLAPQLITKGGILHGWGKRLAVVVDQPFFNSLPLLAKVAPTQAEIAWLIYQLSFKEETQAYDLQLAQQVGTRYDTALAELTTAPSGDIGQFVSQLQLRLQAKLEQIEPPDTSFLENE